MIYRKSIIVGILLFLIVLVVSVVILGGASMNPEKALEGFSRQIEQGKLNDIRLTIYYVNPFYLTLHPWSVDDLIKASGEQKIVIDGDCLVDYISYLERINTDVFVPVEQKTILDARLYYVFETKKNRKIFDVVMWGGDDTSIFINGLEVKGDDVFYDVIKPFLPASILNDFEAFIARHNI